MQARQSGVRGETYAYWYLRRHGYDEKRRRLARMARQFLRARRIDSVVARNYMHAGVKGEIDMVGYDGPVLAFERSG